MITSFRTCSSSSQYPSRDDDISLSPGFYAGQFNKGVREGHGVRVVNPNTQLKEAFASKKGLSESTTEVPSVSDLEELLGAKIFEEFSPTDVSRLEIYVGH